MIGDRLSPRKIAHVMTRGLLAPLGVMGIMWSSSALPSFWLTVAAREVAAQIIAADRFKPGILAGLLTHMRSAPLPSIVQPEFVRARALISSRAAEESTQRKSPEEVDRDFRESESNVRDVLSVNPGDAFLWLTLYSLVTARNGFETDNIGYLNQSYAAGPNEGWIALRRNRLALAIFALQSELLQHKVVAEFAALVDSDFIDDAAINLTSVGWVQRERLLASLGNVDVLSRKAFARRLAQDGVAITVPGIAADNRWRR